MALAVDHLQLTLAPLPLSMTLTSLPCVRHLPPLPLSKMFTCFPWVWPWPLSPEYDLKSFIDWILIHSWHGLWQICMFGLWGSYVMQCETPVYFLWQIQWYKETEGMLSPEKHFVYVVLRDVTDEGKDPSQRRKLVKVWQRDETWSNSPTIKPAVLSLQWNCH